MQSFPPLKEGGQGGFPAGRDPINERVRRRLPQKDASASVVRNLCKSDSSRFVCEIARSRFRTGFHVRLWAEGRDHRAGSGQGYACGTCWVGCSCPRGASPALRISLAGIQPVTRSVRRRGTTRGVARFSPGCDARNSISRRKPFSDGMRPMMSPGFTCMEPAFPAGLTRTPLT